LTVFPLVVVPKKKLWVVPHSEFLGASLELKNFEKNGIFIRHPPISGHEKSTSSEMLKNSILINFIPFENS